MQSVANFRKLAQNQCVSEIIFCCKFFRAKILPLEKRRAMISVSVEQAVKEMRREFRDLTNQEFNKGVARAINHTLGKAKTASNREIRTIYNISAKHVNEAFKVKKAGPAELYALLIAQGKPLPLRIFKPVQNSDGVSIMVRKGQRQTIKSAFLTTMPSGHTGVFARGSYKQGGYNFRHKRITPAGGYKQVGNRYQPINNDTPINTLTTTSVPLMFSQNIVINALSKKIVEDFPTRMVHELSRIRG